jgi:3-deoxy-D-manno-octulosonate 8-phosphate phosphatase (KDO 8-P phosphatase)
VSAPVTGPVRILFLDLDGTLTDGLIIYDATGDARDFFIRDGLALEWSRGLDLLPVVISGRPSRAAELRLTDLGVEHHLGIRDKVAVAERVLAREGVAWDACAMVGDDLPDVPLMKRVAWRFAVADAIPLVRELAHTVTAERGGRGAVREVVETLLRHNGTWQQVLERYEAS